MGPLGLQTYEEGTPRPLPQELQLYHDYESLPSRLRDILTWSLDTTHSPTKRTPSNSSIAAEEILKGSKTHSEEHTQTNQLGAECSTTTAVSSQNKNDKRLPDSRSSKSIPTFRRLQNVSKRPFIRENGMHGILESTRDLLTAFKQKAEKTGPPRSKSETILVHNPSFFECTSCFEEFPQAETAKLPCSHSYCKACLATLVMTALQNETNYPPKCCLSEIPLLTALYPLDTKQREIYKEKAAEYSIPAQERWYCPNARCSKWIPPAKLQRIRHLNQKCPHCSSKICSVCRGPAHSRSVDCPQDFGLEATISLAELEGWRRCYRCRALVERASGCRHMTCKCGSQFCYVCGAKWRTCHCTEVDEANRQAALRRRRRDRQTVVDTEAEELARAIAEVEALQHREAEDRQRAQAQQEAERRREEAELARLEEERVQEEAARRLEEERLEREYRLALRESVTEACNAMQSALVNIIQTQKQTLDSRHMRAKGAYLGERDCALAKQMDEGEELQAKLKSNIDRRTALIHHKHRSDLDVFTSEQDEFEDDLFLEIRMHLHGKSDKEARERRLHEKFKNQRNEKLQDLLKKHEMEIKSLTLSVSTELDVLKRASDDKITTITTKYANYLEAHRTTVASDLAWFRLISERRHNMVSSHARLLLAAVDADEEPLGLTEEQAAAIGPFPTGHTDPRQQDDHLVPSPASSTSLTPTPSIVELAATSNRLLSTLEPQLAPSIDAGSTVDASSNQLLMNSAEVWIAGGDHTSARTSRTAEENQFPSEAGPSIRRRVMVGHARKPRRPSSGPRFRPSSSSAASIPPVPEVPTMYLGENELHVKMPGAYPVSQKTSNHGEASGSPAQAPSRQHVYQRYSWSESNPSVTESTASLSIVSDYSTSPSSVGSLPIQAPVTDAAEPPPHRSLSPSALPATPFPTSPAASSREQHRHAKGISSFDDLRMAVKGSGDGKGKGKGKKPKYTEEEVRERMKRAVGDAFGA
ncbi:uncharacterized protein PV06_10451 [Exophiala oligosperma]|nr:uncharacterized protein PV06_10451 [Exophiala oligosperma]KIW37409.1 hypothetical protein PV06_10451 [Exophiala oligosperma]